MLFLAPSPRHIVCRSVSSLQFGRLLCQIGYGFDDGFDNPEDQAVLACSWQREGSTIDILIDSLTTSDGEQAIAALLQPKPSLLSYRFLI